jgi:membrane fusion protein (multidrug efflux system)
LGQSTATLAVIADGLKQGESVIVEGLQRARPGIQVKPGPMGPQPGGPPAGGPSAGGKG